jgi:serine-type D-Ala-D-Ala carboxypeptidase/endopeptidase (penicillin-binding protein 4)
MLYRQLLLVPIFISCFTAIIIGQNVQAAFNALANDGDFKHAGLSMSAIEVETGKKIAEWNAELCLIPASTLKIVTTSTALAILGENYTFKTELQYDGNIDASGTLRGNLYVKGFGDPTLGSEQMPNVPNFDAILKIFASEVKKAGIKKITGLVVGDATHYNTTDVTSLGWQWDDIGNYYAAGVWGLNIRENAYDLFLKQNPKIGGAVSYAKTEPHIPNLVVMSEVSAAASGADNSVIFGAPYTYNRLVNGTIPAGKGLFKVKGSMPDPAFLTAHYLMKALEDAGIRTNKLATTQVELLREAAPALFRKTIFIHRSPSIKAIVQRANLESVNLYCESMLKAIGMKVKSQGSTEAGVAALRDFWSVRGVDLNAFVAEDGSGISTRNAVSAQHLTVFLNKIYADKTIFNNFYPTLPEAGKTGTLKDAFGGTGAVGKIRAKTGSMKRVRCYAGYAKTQSGKLVAFSILTNNFTGSFGNAKQKIENAIAEICKLP